MMFTLLFLFLSIVECHWIQEIRLHHYSNPFSSRYQKSLNTILCCDPSGSPSCSSDPCDNSFIFCLRKPNTHGCQYGRYETGLVAANDDSLTFGDTIGSNNVPNPLIFNGTEWPNNGQLEFRTWAFDMDNNMATKIDSLIFHVNFISVLPPGGLSKTVTLRGNLLNTITLQISSKISCDHFYYGNRCEVFCQPHNDDINGHYTCDTQGNIVCNTGYQMNETNCTTSTCQPSCGSNGQCISPNTCQCINGRTGPTCDICTNCSTTTNMIIPESTLPISISSTQVYTETQLHVVTTPTVETTVETGTTVIAVSTTTAPVSTISTTVDTTTIETTIPTVISTTVSTKPTTVKTTIPTVISTTVSTKPTTVKTTIPTVIITTVSTKPTTVKTTVPTMNTKPTTTIETTASIVNTTTPVVPTVRTVSTVEITEPIDVYTVESTVPTIVLTSNSLATTGSPTTKTQDNTQKSLMVAIVFSGVFVLMTIILVLIAIIILTSRRLYHLKKNKDHKNIAPLDNPNYSPSIQNRTNFCKDFDNPLYECSGSVEVAVGNTVVMDNTDYSLLQPITEGIYSEPSNYLLLQNCSTTTEDHSQVQSQEPIYDLATNVYEDVKITNIIKLPEGHYEFDPNIIYSKIKK